MVAGLTVFGEDDTNNNLFNHINRGSDITLFHKCFLLLHEQTFFQLNYRPFMNLLRLRCVVGMIASLLCLFSIKAEAQYLKLIKNPEPGNVDISSNVVYNGQLYFGYKDSSGKNLLASFNDTSINLIHYTGDSPGYNGYPIVYNGNLYFQNINHTYKHQLAKYDGNTVTLIQNPDGGGYLGCPIVYNGNLFFDYTNERGTIQLAKYDGSTISLIPNPDSGQVMFLNPIVFNNNLIFEYQIASLGTKIAKYTNKSINIIPSPIEGNGVIWAPIIYKDSLFFPCSDSLGFSQLARTDGNSFYLIKPFNTFGKIYEGYPAVYNNCLYYVYINNNGGYIQHQIAKYDGHSYSGIYQNPDIGDGIVGSPIVYNGNLYYRYHTLHNIYKFANCKDSLITLVNSPDEYGGYSSEKPIVYNGNLYCTYVDSFVNRPLAKYDGTSVEKIPCPEADTLKYAGNAPLVYHNKLYLVYHNTLIGQQLAVLVDTSKINLPINFFSFTATANNKTIQINWHTSNEITTNHFIIQQSIDGSLFTEIGTVKAIGSGANGYSFTDAHPTNGTNYYRLQSVEKDGESTFSKVVSCEWLVVSKQFTVFPNPAHGNVTINGNHIASVQVVDNIGRVVKTVLLKDASNPTLSVGGLQAGVYHLRVQTTDGKVSGVGFVKE